MALAGILILALFIASAVLLVLIVLIQDDQGEGIGGMFGGGESSTPFGSRTGNVLTKFTSILGAVFLICAFALAWLNRTPERDDILEQARLRSIESEAGQWWVRPVAPAGDDAQPQTDGAQTDDTGGTVGQAEAGDTSGGSDTSGGGSTQ